MSAECKRLRQPSDTGPDCGCLGACSLGIRLQEIISPTPAERIEITARRLAGLLDALDAGIEALVKLSKTGSLHKSTREAALQKMWQARQDKLFEA